MLDKEPKIVVLPKTLIITEEETRDKKIDRYLEKLFDAYKARRLVIAVTKDTNSKV